MAKALFRTDRRLWLVAAGCAFVALGFVDPVAGVAKGHNSLWAYVGLHVTGDYFCSTADIVVPILFLVAPQAVLSAALGWVLQAFVVVARSRGRGAAPGSMSTTQGNRTKRPADYS